MYNDINLCWIAVESKVAKQTKANIKCFTKNGNE